MLLNLGTVGVYAAALTVRDPVEGPGALGLALEAVGAGMLLVAGWMGGTLVARNQIGVDHRYAGAGRWQEEAFETRNGRPLTVARIDDLDVDQMKLLHVNGQRIVLARSAEGYVAFSDRCTHTGASLCDGAMVDGVVQCPWHGSQFDVHSGALRAGPAEEGIETFRVREASGNVLLEL
jgi:nitrite reductase/ring-hydroxylating ferredoxin subunit